MRYPTEHKTKVKGRLVSLGARLVRAKGVLGLSVGGVMSAAKMTVGGFYRHFDSQEALAAESLGEAMRESVARLTEGLDDTAPGFERALVERYLSDWHFTHPELGCPIAAAGPDLARLPAKARAPLLREAKALVDRLARALGGGAPATARAWTVLCACAGAMAMARALGPIEGPKLLAAVGRTLSSR